MLPEYKTLLNGHKWNIFGMDMLPLSLGHVYLLEAIDSPLVVQNKDIGADDILLAAWICSMQPNEFWAFATSDLEEIKQKAYSVGKVFGSKADYSITENAEYFGKEAQKLNEYITHYLTSPQRWQSKENKPTKTPWQIYLVTQLQRELGIDEQTAWDMPCNKAFVYFSAMAEAQGDDNIKSEDDVYWQTKVKKDQEEKLMENK